MKTILVILFSGLLATLAAPTNEWRWEILETKQGTFTNAQISTLTAASATVLHDQGITKIWLTNFSESIQTNLGYSPARAAAQLKSETDKKERQRLADIERRKYMASLAGPVQTVHLVSIVDNFGQCVISTTNGQQTAYVLDLPASVRTFFTSYYGLKNSISEGAATVKRMSDAASRASATAPTAASGDAAYVNAAMSERKRANIMVDDANQAGEKLAEMKLKFVEMELDFAPATTFNAYNTGLKDNGIARWQAVQ